MKENKFLAICLTVIMIFIAGLTIRSYYANHEKIYIPEIPIALQLHQEKSLENQIFKVVNVAGELMAKECQWTDEKIEKDYYLPYAKIDIKVSAEYVTAQAIVDRSVCPEK